MISPIFSLFLPSLIFGLFYPSFPLKILKKKAWLCHLECQALEASFYLSPSLFVVIGKYKGSHHRFKMLCYLKLILGKSVLECFELEFISQQNSCQEIILEIILEF